MGDSLIIYNLMLLFYIWGKLNTEELHRLKELRETDYPEDIEKDDEAYERYQKELRELFAEELSGYTGDKQAYGLSQWNPELTRMTLLRELRQDQYAQSKSEEALHELLLAEAQYFYAKEKAIEIYDRETPEEEMMAQAAHNGHNVYIEPQYG